MRVVVVANIVMSLDNVIAVAAAAKGNYLLLGLGLAISIPVVIAGSALFLALPVIPHLKITDMGLVDVDRFELIAA